MSIASSREWLSDEQKRVRKTFSLFSSSKPGQTVTFSDSVPLASVGDLHGTVPARRVADAFQKLRLNVTAERVQEYLSSEGLGEQDRQLSLAEFEKVYHGLRDWGTLKVADRDAIHECFEKYSEIAKGEEIARLTTTGKKPVLLKALADLSIRCKKNDAVYEKFIVPKLEPDGGVGLQAFTELCASTMAPASRYGLVLRQAARRGEDSLVSELIARGCDPNDQDGKGWSAVHHAAEYGRSETLRVMGEACGKERKLDVDIPDKRGWTAFMCAASNGHITTVKVLKSLGANMNKQNIQGRTALCWAAARGQTDMVRFLLGEKDKAIDLQDRAGLSALVFAVLHEHGDCVRALVAAGARTDLKDSCGYTVHRYASEKMNRVIRGTPAASPRTPRHK